MRHLGQICSVNNSIMLVLVAAEDAPRWHGSDNGPAAPDPAGSDWEKALNALHPETVDDLEATRADAFEIEPGRRIAVRVSAAETQVMVVGLSDSGPGVVDVLVDDGRIVLCEGYYELEGNDGLAAFVSGLPRNAQRVGSIHLPSGLLACIPSPSAGRAFAGHDGTTPPR